MPRGELCRTAPEITGCWAGPASCLVMLARDPFGIVLWSERLEEGKEAVVGTETGALGALVRR